MVARNAPKKRKSAIPVSILDQGNQFSSLPEEPKPSDVVFKEPIQAKTKRSSKPKQQADNRAPITTHQPTRAKIVSLTLYDEEIGSLDRIAAEATAKRAEKGRGPISKSQVARTALRLADQNNLIRLLIEL